MATQPQTGLTYEDLEAFPEDNLRRELIDGELIVTAAPGRRHQNVVLELGARLLAYSKKHGGAVYVAPRDVYLANDTVLEPDVVFVKAENLARDEERFVRGAPDIVVEVSRRRPDDWSWSANWRHTSASAFRSIGTSISTPTASRCIA